MALFVVALLTLGLSSAAIAADQTYVSTGTEANPGTFSSEGTGNGELTHPRRSVVESSTGNVLIADRDNSRVQVFAPTVEAAEYLTQFGAGTLDKPFGLAIDQGTGDVYVSDPGNGEVFKFTSDGAPTPVYSLDATFTSPTQGSGGGQLGSFEADLAVDPASGDLIVLDVGNDRVSRFQADGTYVSSFTGADSPDGAFTGLLDLDVAPNGDIYVVDSTGPVYVANGEVGEQGECVNSAYCDSAPSRVLRFDSAGVYQTTVRSLQGEAAGLVTVDPDNDQVLVGRINPQNATVWVYAPLGARPIDTFNPPNPFTFVPSLAAGAGRLYVVNDWEPGGLESYAAVAVKVFSPLNLPDVAIDPPATPGTSGVQLSGEVHPQGQPATWRFEYRLAGEESWSGGPSGDAGEGTSPVDVSGDLTGLEPNQPYEARLIAIGYAGKEVISATVSFTTEATAPVVSTAHAAPRTTTTARINGYVNARNNATTYRFEWGPTASYGNSVPVGSEGQVGSGGTAEIVAQQLTGLSPETTYHFRIVATNSVGTTVGQDQAFTTRSAAEMVAPRRGIELASAADKGNQSVSGWLVDGAEKVVWTAMTGTPGSPIGKGPLYAAQRTPGGWISESLLPAPASLIGGGHLGYVLTGASSDYSELIFQVGEGANTGVTGDPHYFARFEPASQQQEILDFFPGGELQFETLPLRSYTSPDARHVYVAAKANTESSTPAQLYDLGEGTRRLIGILPETGQAPACGVSLGTRRPSLLSKDGSHFFFMTRGDDCGGPSSIYVFDNQGTEVSADDTVTRVSGPPLPGPEADSYVVQPNADGTSLVYQSSARLTPDDTNEVRDLYRWTEGQGSECLTCFVPDAGVDGLDVEEVDNVLVSADLSHVYISTPQTLVPDPGAGPGSNLYVIVDGQPKFISRGVTDLFSSLRWTGAVTPNGRTMVFMSDDSGITADTAGGTRQLYRYSEDEGDAVECISCPGGGLLRDVQDPPVDAKVTFGTVPTGAEARALTDDGETYVFVTSTALVPGDANGDRDLYEWHNGALSLITDGEGEYGGAVSAPLSLEGISRDGVNVLFRLSAPLTGFEQDGMAQLFVAHTGGGFIPPERQANCLEDACQGPLEQVPPFSQPGSVGLVGAGNAVRSAESLKRVACKRRAKQARKKKKRVTCAKGARRHKSHAKAGLRGGK